MNKLILFGIVICLLMSACSAYMHQPMRPHSASLGEPTSITHQLRKLPPPQQKIVAAVYKFRDQTGQYKPSEIGASWSTAVTQGATNILIKALEESGWFTPIERENYANLDTERRIIRLSRAQYEKSEGPQPQLPPLLFAGLILEGGIVSYDANVLTGGAGARYFGAGGSAQYRQDRVTVYLRAISTSSGEILKTVYTSKTILSQAMEGGIFRYVAFRRLLEVETGFSFNEPSEIAVMEAIEKAVQTLILEGLEQELWDTAPNAQDEKNEALKSFKEEKEAIAETNYLGRRLFQRNNAFGLRISGALLQYRGDLPNPTPRAGVEVSLEVPISPRFGVQVNGGVSSLATDFQYAERVIFGDLNLTFRLLPHDRFSPIFYGGAGLLFDEDGRSDLLTSRDYFKIQSGGGIEYFFTPAIGLDLLFDYNYLLDDRVDRLPNGQYNDVFYRLRLGLHIRFGQPKPRPNSSVGFY